MDTPRSSITHLDYHDNRPSSSHIPRSLSAQLEQEIVRDEERFEEYGGDDVKDPPGLKSGVRASYPLSPSDTIVEEPSNIVSWDGPNDKTNPQNWTLAYKWSVVAICVIMTVNVTFASSAPTSVTQEVIQEFGISREVSFLITSLFLVGYVFGGLIWGPGSELYGRRPVLVIALSLYTILHLGQALAKNIETLLVTRFLAGLFAVAPLTISGGVIADMMSAVDRGYATSFFSASVFLGPVLGPVVGGFIAASDLSWRWVFWVMMMFAGFCTVIPILFLPETYAPVLLLKKAQRLRKSDPVVNKDLKAEHENQDWSFSGVVNRTLYRPFKMLLLEPILVLITIYLSLVYGVLYALFEAFPIIFIETRGFTITQNGLIFIGVGIGTTLGAIGNYLLSRQYPELMVKWRGFPPPEQRLFGAMIGAPLLVVSSFWLGWTGQYSSIPWYVPGISVIFIGASIAFIFMSFLSYLVDTYLMYSASAFAANNMIRSLVGAAFPLFTVQMYQALGINWASTLIGLVGLLLAPSPYLFYWYGPRIRKSSKFAPCIDLKIAEELEREQDEKLKV